MGIIAITKTFDNSYNLFSYGHNHWNGLRKMIHTCRESRMLKESYSCPGSIFAPKISCGINENRRQHCNRGGVSMRNKVTTKVNLQALTQI